MKFFSFLTALNGNFLIVLCPSWTDVALVAQICASCSTAMLPTSCTPLAAAAIPKKFCINSKQYFIGNHYRQPSCYMIGQPSCQKTTKKTGLLLFSYQCTGLHFFKLKNQCFITALFFSAYFTFTKSFLVWVYINVLNGVIFQQTLSNTVKNTVTVTVYKLHLVQELFLPCKSCG